MTGGGARTRRGTHAAQPDGSGSVAAAENASEPSFLFTLLPRHCNLTVWGFHFVHTSTF